MSDPDAALRRSISIHCPDQDEVAMAARVEIARMRDSASAGLTRCSPEAHGMLLEIVRLATPSVFANHSTSRLLRIRLALWLAMESARAMERIARD